MRNRLFKTILILAVATLCMSCNRHTVYNHYEHVTQGGWEKNDTLFYQVPPVKEAGTYEEIIGIRTDINFPFQSIALNVAQDVTPQGTHYQTTKNCLLYDASGKERGSGISRFQNEIYLTDIHLNKGDSVSICITHNMRRELMSGITDIGIILKRK